MSVSKKFYHNIDLLNVGQLIGARSQVVTTLERTTLGGTLGAANEGVRVWDTNLKKEFVWDGAVWVEQAITIEGDVIFRGVLMGVDFAVALPHTAVGSQYKAGEAGTLAFPGYSFTPSATVEAGDQLLVISADTIAVIQRNDNPATEIQAGNIRISTEAETLAGSLATVAVPPAHLAKRLQTVPNVFFTTITVGAGTPVTVTHNLGLVDKDSFVINVMENGSNISVDVDAVDINSLTLTALVSVTDAKVTVMGSTHSV